MRCGEGRDVMDQDQILSGCFVVITSLVGIRAHNTHLCPAVDRVIDVRLDVRLGEESHARLDTLDDVPHIRR